MTDREVFEDTLLGFLCEGPRHGYDLALCFAEGGDLAAVGRLAKSQLYALLKSLEAQGLARAKLREGGSGPARRVFEATEQGRERFLRWVRKPVDSVRGLRVEFLLKLYFLRRFRLPGQAELMDAQAELLRCRLAEVRGRSEAQAGIGPWVRALQEGLLEAGLRWLADWRERVPEERAPQPLAVAAEAAEESREPNRLPARVTAVEGHGAMVRVDLEAEAGRVAALLPKESFVPLALVPGSAVTVVLPPGAVVLMPSGLSQPR